MLPLSPNCLSPVSSQSSVLFRVLVCLWSLMLAPNGMPIAEFDQGCSFLVTSEAEHEHIISPPGYTATPTPVPRGCGVSDLESIGPCHRLQSQIQHY